MRHCIKISMAFSASVLLAEAAVHALDIPVASGKVSMQITSCLVSSVKSPGKTYDCTTEANKSVAACNGTELCEIPIGYNLTAGKDIDPGSGFLGKRVKIVYQCGAVSQQWGPYNQDDHASLVMDCSGAWW